jgi:hypothetical protein
MWDSSPFKACPEQAKRVEGMSIERSSTLRVSRPMDLSRKEDCNHGCGHDQGHHNVLVGRYP